MYTIPAMMEASLRTNASLREYARLEYGHEDALWLLAAARQPREKPLRRPWRFPSLRSQPAPRPVACKGTPRREPSESPSPG